MRGVVLAVGLTVAVSAGAQGVRVQGLGNVSCGEYMEHRQRNSDTQNGAYASWIWGYMAGFNMEAVNPTKSDGPNLASTLAYMDKYCRENPLKLIIQGADALVHELGGKSRYPRQR